MFQAVGQVPIPIGPAARLDDSLQTALVFHVAVVDALALEPRMEEIGPTDDDGDDEEFGSEGEPSAIERMDSRDHGLASLDEQLVTPQAEAGFRVHLRPSRQKAVQLLLARRFNGGVFLARSDFGYDAMID